MSTSPPSSRIQTPPSDAVTRSGRARKPVDRSGYVDSGEIDDSQESGGEEEDYYDDDFVEERKWKRSRSSEDDDDEGVDEDSQVSSPPSNTGEQELMRSLRRVRRKLLLDLNRNLEVAVSNSMINPRDQVLDQGRNRKLV